MQNCAKDVKLQDITSDEWNEDILRWLRDEHPEFQYFSIATERHDDGDFLSVEGTTWGGWVTLPVGTTL
jgi:hypothetical protein